MSPLSKKPNRRELLALPSRAWDTESTYDSLYLVPTGRKHESGFGLIAIVGVTYNATLKVNEAEIAAFCDVVNWSVPRRHPYTFHAGTFESILRTDCLFPGGILHMWASGEAYFAGRFHVGLSLSSTTVTLVLESRGKDPTLLTKALERGL